MFEKVIYCCSNCKKEFNSKKECKLHEKECKKSFAIRRYEIEVNNETNDNVVEIKQIDFPNAIKDGDFIKLNDLIICNNIQFERVQYYNCNYYVYTTDCSEKHKKELAEKLIKNKMSYFDDYIKALNHRKEIFANSLKNNDYVIIKSE